jgi:hypothetical protein
MSHTMTFSIDEREILGAAAECEIIGLAALIQQLPHIDEADVNAALARLARSGLLTVSDGARTPAIAVTNFGRRTLREIGNG